MRSRIHPLVALGLALVFATGLVGAAFAAGPAKDEDAKGKAADQGPVNVQLPPVLAPMIVNGRLTGYAFITIALTPASRDKVLAIRAKVPFLQDAFLRELNGATIVKADDPTAVDVEAARARLFARTKTILAPGTVTSLKFEQVVMTPVKPGS